MRPTVCTSNCPATGSTTGRRQVSQGGPNSSQHRQLDRTQYQRDWNDRYNEIFTANNILEKGVKAQVTMLIRNRYFAEARFFRAYAYFKLVKKYGDVPLVLKTLDINSPEFTCPARQEQMW